jgi:hypothetical protein
LSCPDGILKTSLRAADALISGAREITENSDSDPKGVWIGGESSEEKLAEN